MAKVKQYGLTMLFPLGMYGLFALLAWAFGGDLFFSRFTTEGIFTDSVLNCIVALAIAIPLSGGRWDFAPGSIAMLGGILGCSIGLRLHANVVAMLFLCIAACLALALFEGLAYIALKAPNMIVSLGIVMVYEAASTLFFKGAGVNLFGNEKSYTDHLLLLSKSPYCFILLAIVLAVSYVLLYKTKFGCDMKSLGANARLAVNAGVREKGNILKTYALIGCLLGFAALLNASSGKIEPANNLSSTGLMFGSMAPVLVGLFLSNFSNLPWGVLIGSIGMKVFSYGMNAFGIDGSIQTIVTGVVLTAIMAYISRSAR